MKLYELYTVLKPSLNEDGLNKFVSETTEAMAKGGFGITFSKIKLGEYLPYPIKHCIQGHTVDLELSGAEESVFPPEIEIKLRHSENILRYLLLAKSEKMLKKTKPLPVFEARPYRTERRQLPVLETAPIVVQKEPPVEINTEEVDKKIEELLK
ncbi:MAG: 30S ribosomal protein S6 [bacterium]|nr:30S ribosomal protein S6 [bacterium]